MSLCVSEPSVYWCESVRLYSRQVWSVSELSRIAGLGLGLAPAFHPYLHTFTVKLLLACNLQMFCDVLTHFDNLTEQENI